MSCAALLQIGSIYAAYPGQQLMLIASFDIRAPQITVLSSASVYTNGVFDKVRMVWNSASDRTVCHLEIHYCRPESDAASTSALVAGVFNTNWRFDPHNFVLVDDVVAEELIAVPEIAIHQTSSGELNPTETAAQTVALSLCEDVTPAEGAANSYSRSADGQVVVNVDVAADDTAGSVCAANLPEGYRPAATVSSGDVTIQTDGKVMVSGSGTGSVCYF